jgi:uncharacterized 2Fe-2S/4Fe-4S cluster protein (DUF4445 family)
MGICGKCKVKIAQGAVLPPTALEHQKLTAAEIESGYRLACQTRVHNNLIVYIPSLSVAGKQQINLACEKPDKAAEPVITNVLITLQPSLPEKQRSYREWLMTEVAQSYGVAVTAADPGIMDAVQALLIGGTRTVRVFIRTGELIDVAPSDQSPLGVAVDLGTTKIAAYLVDMSTGELYGAAGVINPQSIFGEDVMSRIAYAIEHGGAQCQKAVVDGLNSLIKKLCPSTCRILEITIAGNTAMHHLLLGLPVRQLGLAPYVPAVTVPIDVKARDLGIECASGAYIHMLPNVGGFVGGDHVAMVLATGLHETSKTVLGVDIGTNTEIVLAHRGALRSTSCASGPAFEGSHITCGMRAVSGAIEKLCIQDLTVQFQTIDGVPPVGLCGSGILDAVAELFRYGIITQRGKIAHNAHILTSYNVTELVLVPQEKSGTGENIIITQQDILEVQLAKAAIRTGIELLLADAHIGIDAVDEIILTGEFGTRINPASGVAIGMFPPFHTDKFRLIDNATGLGAMRILICKAQRVFAGEISKRMQHLDLMTHPGFHKQFANALYIPSK